MIGSCRGKFGRKADSGDMASAIGQ